MDACATSVDNSVTIMDNSTANMVTSTFMNSASIYMNSSADTNSSVSVDIPVAMHPSKRHRKANYSSHAVDVLVSEVAARRSVLFSCSGRPNVSNEAKLREWEKVAARMNQVCDTPRSVREVRKKWHTYCSEVRRKAMRRRRQLESQVGTPIHLDRREEKVLALIPTINNLFLTTSVTDTYDLDSTSDVESVHADGGLTTIKHELDTDDSFVMSPKSESSASLPVVNTYASQGVTPAVHAGNTPHRRTPPQLRDLEITDAGANAGAHTHGQVNSSFSTSVDHMGAPVKPILVVPHNTNGIIDAHDSSCRKDPPPVVPPEGVTSASQSPDARLQAGQSNEVADCGRLAIERERLAIERDLLEVKRRRLVVEEKKLKVAQHLLRQARREHTSHAIYSLFGELLK